MSSARGFRSTSNGGWARTSLAPLCLAQRSFSSFSSRALSAALGFVLRDDNTWRDTTAWPLAPCDLCCCKSDLLDDRKSNISRVADAATFVFVVPSRLLQSHRKERARGLHTLQYV